MLKDREISVASVAHDQLNGHHVEYLKCTSCKKYYIIVFMELYTTIYHNIIVNRN